MIRIYPQKKRIVNIKYVTILINSVLAQVRGNHEQIRIYASRLFVK